MATTVYYIGFKSVIPKFQHFSFYKKYHELSLMLYIHFENTVNKLQTYDEFMKFFQTVENHRHTTVTLK